eukprot:c42475_g1_i1 orf=221-442(+)
MNFFHTNLVLRTLLYDKRSLVLSYMVIEFLKIFNLFPKCFQSGAIRQVFCTDSLSVCRFDTAPRPETLFICLQ